MLKFFATDVSVSKGYDGSPALRFSESDGVSRVRFRVGKRVYDSRCENNHRYINLRVKAIVIDTLSGRTGRYVAAFRGQMPVYAVCYRKSTMRQLALSYGVHAIYCEPSVSREGFLLNILYYLEDRKWLSKEDLIVVLGGSFGAATGASFLEIGNVLNLEHKALSQYNAYRKD